MVRSSIHSEDAVVLIVVAAIIAVVAVVSEVMLEVRLNLATTATLTEREGKKVRMSRKNRTLASRYVRTIIRSTTSSTDNNRSFVWTSRRCLVTTFNME